MITRTVKQVNVFDIKSHSDTIGVNDNYTHIPGLTWINGQVWKSDEECQRLYKKAFADWRHRRDTNPTKTTAYQPELVVYWKTIDILEEDDE